MFNASLCSADLRCAILTETALRYADLQNADLRYADLRGARFACANLEGADLRYADLEGARFIRSNLFLANLFGAKHIHTADFTHAKMDDKLRDYIINSGGKIR